MLTDTTVLLLRQQGYAAKGVYGAQAAMEEARAWRPQLALMDVVLPDGNGIEAAQALALEMPDLRIVLLSGQPMAELLGQGASGTLGFEVWTKPIAPPKLWAKIRELGF